MSLKGWVKSKSRWVTERANAAAITSGSADVLPDGHEGPCGLSLGGASTCCDSRATQSARAVRAKSGFVDTALVGTEPGIMALGHKRVPVCRGAFSRATR